MINIYGYVRVSTKEQKEDRQLAAMSAEGISLKNIYTDKQSGKNFDRPQYRKLLRKIKKNDLLYIKSIDRLGRNYEEIRKQWQLLTKEKGVDIVVIVVLKFIKKRIYPGADCKKISSYSRISHGIFREDRTF